MRTTVDIAAPILKQLKDLQKREGGTLGALVSRLLAKALSENRSRSAPPFHWTTQRMGAMVALEDKEAVYAVLDREEPPPRP
jgi:hypothetical protein